MNSVVKLSIALIFSVLLIVIVLFVSTSDSDFAEGPQRFADLGGDFTLTSHDGKVSLSDFKGKVVVLYFGFLTCPEVCPNSMSVIRTAFDRLPTQQALSTQAILVSVDPKRDTPEKLAEYTEFYHPRLIGLTGSRQQLDSVTRQYGAFYDFSQIENSGTEYSVEHSSRYYVIDREGELVAAMRHSTTPNELVAQIEELL